MERHVFKFGESSLALVVPKPWTEKNALKPTDTVYLSETDGGDLVISSKGSVKKHADMVIDKQLKPILLSRWVGMHYMYGTGKLHIHSKDNITVDQLEALEERISADCAGFEITSQTNDDIKIEDFMDTKEVTLTKIQERLKALIGFEFREMIEGDPNSVKKIEKLVNRFYMLGTRYTYIMQPKEELKHFKVLELMERISDNINLIATQKDRKHTKVFEQLRKQFDQSFLGFEGNMKVIEEIAKGREEIIKLISASKMQELEAQRFKEIADYISNIAEFGLRV